MDPDPRTPSPRAVCLFTSGSRPLGVGLEAVAEIVESGRLVRVPLCPRPVLGLWTYRGKIVPILGMAPDAREPSSRRNTGQTAFLILRASRGLWGLAIDRGGVRVEVVPAVRRAGGPALPGGFVPLGEVECGGSVHAILDHDRTWIGLKAEIDRWYALALDHRRPAVPAASPAS